MNKQDDLLLTDEELDKLEEPFPIEQVATHYVSRLYCEAQLAKALPIIEKQERERTIEMLGHCRETRRGYIGSYVVWTHAVEEVWQALKGE